MMKKWSFILCFIFLGIPLLLTGCKHELDELNNIDITPITDSVKVPEEADPVTPEITSEPIVANETIPSETIIQELSSDIDNNGVMDSVQIIEREDGSQFVQVIFNEDPIFQNEWVDLRLLSVDAFEYIDLDRDGEKEIFITGYPNVNSRPLIEVLTLKQSNTLWNMMDVPLNDNGHNCFPFNITRGKEEFDFIISSEFTDKLIHFDASSFYKDDSEANPNSILKYRNNHYKEGDSVAYISSWGMWEAQTGSYDGHNCIIAQQGIEGPYGNCLGRIIIYYDYDENGEIEILNIEYVK